MIRSYRLRKLLAPTVGLQKAAGLLILGFLALFLGGVLSFKNQIPTALRWIWLEVERSLRGFVDDNEISRSEWIIGGVLLALGTWSAYRGLRAALTHILETFNPELKAGKMDVYLRRQQLAQGPRIVAMGGGTGLSTLLRGLKQQSSNITAIVTVTDDGGSSGRLIQDKGMIPPGDIRNCLVALSDAEKAMTDLFQHRFRNDSGSLSGHSIGNLLIAALVDQTHGDFEQAVETASDVLAIRGRVLPATLGHVRLRAVLDGDIEICGETAIVAAGRRIRQLFLDPPDCKAHPAAIEAIRAADLICIGPGSVYTSVIPNLLVPGVAQALRDARAPKVYICNVMTQPGESDSYTASQHVTAILDCVQTRIFDYVLINTGRPSDSALEKYRDAGQHFVEADTDRVRALGVRVLQGNYMSEMDLVRHDPMKVVARLMTLVGR
jgi:uncharacterized cofD-like protein